VRTIFENPQNYKNLNHMSLIIRYTISLLV